MLYRGKETTHSETEFIIYEIKWYIPTSIINLSLLMLRQKLVFHWPMSFRAISLLLFLLLLLSRFCRYLSFVPSIGRVWHRVFFRLVWAQDRSPDTPSIPQNASGLVGLPFKRGASGVGRWTSLLKGGLGPWVTAPWGSKMPVKAHLEVSFLSL